MASIIFVNPPLTTHDRYGVKFQSGGETPPLGIVSLAAVTRDMGLKTEILDSAALKLTIEETAQQIIEKNPDYVGFTAVTVSIRKAAKVAELVRKANPNVTMLIGGSHFTALPEETLKRYPIFDIGCVGESERTIAELVNKLENKADLKTVKGLLLKENGGFEFTEARERIKDLDELPFPAWDLLPDLGKYYCPPVHTLKRIPAGLVISSRGCPGKCMFCDRCVFGNTGSYYSAEYLLKMVKDLHENYGIKEIQFRDDNFTAFRTRLKKFCDLLAKENLDLVWSTTGRVDMINEEILNMLKKAGCWQIWYGVESGSQRILDLIKKRTKLDKIRKAIELTEEAGIRSCGFFMIGHPTETVEEIEQTIKFANSLPLSEAHFSITTPFPGSELYTRVEEFGHFENDWDKMTGWVPLFVPYTLTTEDIRKYSNKAFRTFYFRPRIILGYFKKIRSFKHLFIYVNGFLALLNYFALNFMKRMKKQKA